MRYLKVKRTLSIFLICLLFGFPQLSETIYTPSLPDLAHGLNISDEWAEFTLSVYFMGFALGVFVWGIIADLIGRRPAMLWGITLYVLGSWGCYQSDHIFSLLLWRFIQAFGASTGSVITQTMIRDLYSGVKRNQIFSVIGGVLAFSPAIGPFLGGYMDEIAGWRGNFIFLIGMGGFLLIYLMFKLPETRPLNTKQRSSFGQVAIQFCKDQQLLGYIILIGGSNGIIFSYYAEAPFIFIELLHFTPIQYGALGIVIAIASLFASFVSHHLNKRCYKHEQIILISCYTIGIAALSLTFLFYMEKVYSITPTPLYISVTLLLIGVLFFGIALLIPNALSQALSAYQTMIGTAGALFGLFYYILIAAFIFLMGILHDGTALPMPLYFSLITLLMYLAFYFLVLKKSKAAQVEI